MSYIFTKTIAQAIMDYRVLLRRNLDQVTRQKKLAELKLKDADLFSNNLKLYQAARNIIHDIESSVSSDSKYYSYSGLLELSKFLKDHISYYAIENGRLVHSAQKVSKMIVHAIQCLSLPEEHLTEKIKEKLNHCSEVVAKYGSDEQKNMYEDTLEKRLNSDEEFFSPIHYYFQQLVNSYDCNEGDVVSI